VRVQIGSMCFQLFFFSPLFILREKLCSSIVLPVLGIIFAFFICHDKFGMEMGIFCGGCNKPTSPHFSSSLVPTLNIQIIIIMIIMLCSKKAFQFPPSSFPSILPALPVCKQIIVTVGHSLCEAPLSTSHRPHHWG